MRFARSTTLLLFAALLLAAPLAEARAPRPYVKSVSPLRASVGEKMTIQGFYFTPGYAENTVVLVSKDGRVSYVRSEHSTKRSITITVPAKIERLLRVVDGKRVPTAFRVKVIARRMSRLARGALSQPLIGPEVGGDCDNDGTPNPEDNDDDNDRLPDSMEATARTNPCVPDSDGDRMLDGWEYMSALDLNDNARPYPGKKPFPNALFADAEVDYDGDGMHAWTEHAMWWAGGGRYPIDYSDGDQTTRPVAVPADQPWLDMNGDRELSDDERDFDADSLANIVEYRMLAFEPWVGYPGVVRPDFMDPDTDGDSVLDGPDDQDHDDVSNIREYTRGTWVMNPCDPNPNSRTCPKYMVKGGNPTRPDGVCPSTTQLDGGQVPWTDEFDAAAWDAESEC
jgi:hypothetical protein